MKWKVLEIPELEGYVVEWSEPGNYLLSRRNKIYKSVDLHPPFKLVAEFNAPLLRKLVSSIRLAQRLLRFSVSNLIPLNNGDLFVAFDRSIGVVRNGKFLDLDGLERPCRILRSGVARDTTGHLYFGEYLDNRDRGPINVYKYTEGSDSVSLIYTFPKDSIRHIHGIYFDPFGESLFCLTGDRGGECMIIRTSDEFQTLETIGSGDETWRAVSLLFSEEALFYGTDAEFRTNQLFKLNRISREKRALGSVKGTVFYSTHFLGDSFFGTTVEKFTDKEGNTAAIWSVGPDENPVKLAEFRKDRWNPTFFGFGTIYFPHISSLKSRLFFHISAAEPDNKTFEILPND